MQKVTFIICILMLSACSSAPVKVDYYLLDKDVSAYQNTADTTSLPQLSISRIKLADYLNQPQLAILQNDNRIYYASQHLWAESLYNNIRRSLVNELGKTSKYQVRLISDPSNGNPDYQLDIQIDHLVATDNAKVILAGKFWLMKANKVLTRRDFYLQKDLTNSGFSHAIEQQRLLITELSQQIDTTLLPLLTVN